MPQGLSSDDSSEHHGVAPGSAPESAPGNFPGSFPGSFGNRSDFGTSGDTCGGGSSEVAMPLADSTGPTPNDPVAVVRPGLRPSCYLPAALRGDGGGRGSFGQTLEPTLRHACEGRLSAVNWFRVDWQRGGALTGYATYRDDDDLPQRVVVKLPVPPCERHWLVALQPYEHVAPRIFAHGEVLNGYDLAWVVMERLDYGPLGSAWLGKEFDLLTEAAGRFYAAADAQPRAGEATRKDWFAIFDRSRKHIHDFSLPQTQRWNRAMKKTHRKLKSWAEQWENRPIDHWCHGDLHFGNAMTRTEPPDGPAILFDFARTHVGHWVEDAVFFEHLFWARRKRLDGRKLCSKIAHERKTRGLKVDEHWPDFAQLKRALLAMSTPAMLQHDGDPRHVNASLEVLEQAVG